MKKVMIESNDTSEPMEITDEFYLDEIPSDLNIHIVGQEASSFPIDDDLDDMDDFDFDLDEPSEPPVQTQIWKGPRELPSSVQTQPAKGQLISKGLFDVIIWTKKTLNFQRISAL